MCAVCKVCAYVCTSVCTSAYKYMNIYVCVCGVRHLSSEIPRAQLHVLLVLLAALVVELHT